MRALVLSGGEFHKTFFKEFIKKFKEDHFHLIICADKGLKYAWDSGLKIDYAIGDFDSFPIFNTSVQSEASHKLKETGTAFIRLDPEKDATDTQEAVALAISKGADEIFLLAATGDRLDHSLANVLLLKQFEDVTVFLINEKNKVRLLKPENLYCVSKKEQYGSFISLLPISQKLEGVNITGCKYDLQNKTIFLGDSLGISNEISSDKAYLSLKRGYALLIESKE